MRYKKLLCYILAFLIISAFFISYTLKNNFFKNETIITWYRGKDITPATKELLKAFEKKYPDIKIKYVELSSASSDQYNTYVYNLNKKDSNIDIMTLDIIWVPEFASKNWLYPLDDYFTKENQKNFFESTIKAMTLNGKIYAVPGWTDAGALFYRKDIIKNPPKTWDDLKNLSVENIGKNDIEYGILFQALKSEGLVCNSLEFIWGNGADILDSNNNVILNSKESISAIQNMKNLIDNNISPPSVKSFNVDDTINEFQKGHVLFMRNWPNAWSILNSPYSPLKDKVGICPMPIGSYGKKSAATLGGWNLAINKNSNHLKEAYKFIEFITSEEGQKINATYGSYLATRKSIYNIKEINNKLPWYSEFSAILDIARPRPVSPKYSSISNILQDNISNALSGKVTSEEAISKASKQIKDLIN